MIKICFLTICCMLATINVAASTVPPELITAFNKGNASEISVFFNSTVELTFFDKEEIYSNTQAERILKDFFDQNPPVSFKIIHQGGKESSKYAIGNLKTKQNQYRITFLLKTTNSKIFIHQLRIEESNVE